MDDYIIKYQGNRLPYWSIIALVCIGFMLIIPVSSAETLKVISNTDRCIYQPVMDKDYCKTVYELCDPALDMNKVDFRFKTENDKSLKISIDDLSYFYSSKSAKTDCRVITIEGHKNPYKNVDNVLCYGSNCHEEYAWWNSSFIFKFPINASTTSGQVTFPLLVNDSSVTINGFPQYIWCNYTVNTTRRAVGYLYFTNESFYRCIDETETFPVFMNIDEGNETGFGNPEKELLLWWHANETVDESIYGIAMSDNGCNRITGGKIGAGFNCDRGDTDWMEFADSKFYDSIDTQEAYSWCIWMNPTSWNTGVANDQIASCEGATYPFVVRRSINDAFITWIINTDGGDESVVTGSLPATGSWFHLCGTLGGTEQKIFLNGHLVATNTYNLGDMTAWNSVKIGCRDEGDRCIDGVVDEFTLWNRTLSDDEVQARYNNSVGGQDFAPLGELDLFIRNTALLAINTELSDFILTDTNFINASIINYNTSAANTSFLLLSSMNIEKLNAGGTNVITVRIILDSVETILEEDIRSVSGIGDIGSSGTSPVLFSVSSGEHNLTYQFKRSGPGDINITNFDFNMLQFITVDGNSVRNQLVLTDYNHTDTNFTTAFNWTLNKTLNSSTFILLKNTLTKSGVGSTTATYFFENLLNGDTSPFWQRFLSGSSDVGSVSGIYIDPSEVGLHNHSIQSRQTDAGDFVFVNGSLVDFDLIDSDNFTIGSFQDSNESTNITDTLTLGAGTHLLVESTVFNLDGNSYFLSFMSSFSSTSGSQTPRYFTDSPNLTTEQCFTEKRRSLSDNNDVGNSFAYTICNGLLIDNNYTFRLWVEVEAGETLIQLDESFQGFETFNFSISEGQVAPIASAITNPVNGSNVSGSDTITWIAFFDPNSNLVTYNVTLLNSDGSLNASIGVTISTFFDVNWDSFLPGPVILRVEGCDPTDLCSATNISITIVPTPIPDLRPSTTFCENDILTMEVNTRTISNGNITDEITITRTECIHGCSNASISAFGNPGCIESDLVLALILISVVLITVFTIRRVL